MIGTRFKKLSSIKEAVAIGLMVASMLFASTAQSADYKIDTKGAHAFIQFKIKHLGYSWLLGRFNSFDGTFKYDDAAPQNSSINVTIQTASLDSNHAERDKHLKSEDFLDVKKYPTAVFKSTGFDSEGAEYGILHGELTLHGVTKKISFPIEKVGEGPDPWGGYRAGFSAVTSLALEDYGIKNILGPASANVELQLYIEGIKQK